MSKESTIHHPQAYKFARKNMVETQLISRGITAKNVLDVMANLPRHFFVDEALAAQSYSDSPLPIGEGQTISQPYMVALMTQELKIKKKSKILEIGFGSGYQTAVLASLGAEVYAVERLEYLFEKGRENLKKLNFNNIYFKLDDGTLGWPEKAPFDAILVAAGAPSLPEPLIEQLAPNGSLIIPVGVSKGRQELLLITKDKLLKIKEKNITSCQFVDLIGQHAW